MSTIERVLEERLSEQNSGLILDVASGSGRFGLLISDTAGDDFLPVLTDVSISGLTGIPPEKAFTTATGGNCLAFGSCSFTAASIANSLHHMTSPGSVLQEMMRVLKPGGLLILMEMFSDRHQSPAQQTHTMMHNWWGDVDRSSGVNHNRVFTRERLTTLFCSSKAENISFTDHDQPSGDPFDPELRKRLEKAQEYCIQRAAGNDELLREGDRVWEHYDRHGFASAPSLLATGIKAQ